MQCVKEIDRNASLCPWSDASVMKAINGNEANLLSQNVIGQYIDIPTKSITNSWMVGLITVTGLRSR